MVEFGDYKNLKYVPKTKRFRMLETVSNCLEMSGIPWTIMCGTLLGWCRDGDLIKNDGDADIGVPSKYFKQIPCGMFDYLCNFEVKEFRMLAFRKRIRIEDRVTGFHIDIYELHEKRGGYVFYFDPDLTIYQMVKQFMHKNKKKQKFHVTDDNYMLLKSIIINTSIPRYHIYPKATFDLVKFKKILVRVPRPPVAELWCELTYGRNWFIPVKNYKDSAERKIHRRVKHL
jgi:hypothetical protein